MQESPSRCTARDSCRQTPLPFDTLHRCPRRRSPVHFIDGESSESDWGSERRKLSQDWGGVVCWLGGRANRRQMGNGVPGSLVAKSYH